MLLFLLSLLLLLRPRLVKASPRSYLRTYASALLKLSQNELVEREPLPSELEQLSTEVQKRGISRRKELMRLRQIYSAAEQYQLSCELLVRTYEIRFVVLVVVLLLIRVGYVFFDATYLERMWRSQYLLLEAIGAWFVLMFSAVLYFGLRKRAVGELHFGNNGGVLLSAVLLDDYGALPDGASATVFTQCRDLLYRELRSGVSLRKLRVELLCEDAANVYAQRGRIKYLEVMMSVGELALGILLVTLSVLTML